MSRSLAEITKQLLHTYNRYPRKRLGQHFLIDPQVVNRIIAAAELSADDSVIEIGSGLGVITAEIAERVKNLTAIEIDKELVEISRQVLAPFQNTQIVSGDILKLDLDSLIPQLTTHNQPHNSISQLTTQFKIIGNLPYYITAPIVEKILLCQNKPEIAVIMVQKEVAQRMAANPGSKKYGSFSIFCQFYAQVEVNSFVSKSSFLPWPEVGSAIVVLKPYQKPRYPVKDEKLFFDIVHAAFQQRRKKLSSSLKEYNLISSGIDLNRRPETLSLDEFCSLANCLQQ